ncbi:hypothetical protein J4405_03525 [Candidatus Woesearchaeota archaeon]|nr:hypothetical protein [Candidatus Woesearchaeota archaeon]
MKKMTKKGELSINVIIVAILALIVLVTLVIIFNQQIANVLGGFGSISRGTVDQANNLPEKLFGEDDSDSSAGTNPPATT